MDQGLADNPKEQRENTAKRQSKQMVRWRDCGGERGDKITQRAAKKHVVFLTTAKLRCWEEPNYQKEVLVGTQLPKRVVSGNPVPKTRG